jgi:hypothetical protein
VCFNNAIFFAFCAAGCFLKHPWRRINQKRDEESKESVSRHPAEELQDRSPLQGLLRGRSCEMLSKPLLRSQQRVAANAVFKAMFACQDARQLIGAWIQSRQNVHLHSRRVLFLSATWVAFWLHCASTVNSVEADNLGQQLLTTFWALHKLKINTVYGASRWHLRYFQYFQTTLFNSSFSNDKWNLTREPWVDYLKSKLLYVDHGPNSAARSSWNSTTMLEAL